MQTMEPPQMRVVAATGGSTWLPFRRDVLRSWVSAVMGLGSPVGEGMGRDQAAAPVAMAVPALR